MVSRKALLCPRRESNPHCWFRRPVLYPLSYRGKLRLSTKFTTFRLWNNLGRGGIISRRITWGCSSVVEQSRTKSRGVSSVVEQSPLKRLVGGSNPPRLTKFSAGLVDGSNPSSLTKLIKNPFYFQDNLFPKIISCLGNEGGKKTLKLY